MEQGGSTMNDAELETARLELYEAAYKYARNVNADADEDLMVSVIARLEVAAQRFTEIKTCTIPKAE